MLGIEKRYVERTARTKSTSFVNQLILGNFAGALVSVRRLSVKLCGKIKIYSPELRSSNSNGLARGEISCKLLRMSLPGHRDISRRRSNSVAFGAKRTFSEPRLQNRDL